jgi:alpha-L-fucosidase
MPNRRDFLKTIAAGSVAAAATGCVSLGAGNTRLDRIQSWPLPDLPPMPALPPRRPVGSVPMGDPEAFPVTHMDFPIAPGPFAPTWESIAEHHPGMPAWLREAKFGIWVHFGAQSAGRSGDWYAKRLYLQEGKYRPYYENHLRNYGHPSEVGYKDVLRTWNPEQLDPAAQVRLYRDAGARFLFIQAVHHDNFDNWNSRYQRWNSVNLGPRRDLLREWTSAARSSGLRYGVAFHHEYTWWWYQTAYGSDTTGPKAGVPYDGHLTLADGKGKWWEGYDPRMLYTADLREYQGLDVEFAPLKGVFTNHQEYARWYATWWAYRMMDVIEHYDPDFIYTDGNSTQPFSGSKSGTGMKSDAMQRVAAHYYNRTLARRGAIDTFSVVKFSPTRRGVVNTQEGTIPAAIKTDQPWIGETAVGDWFYSPGFVYDSGAVIRYLLENAARDGATAICVSQQPDGSLDPGSVRMLEEVGAWLAINGDGIYGSKAWVRLGEGDMVDGKLRVAPNGKLGRRHADFRFGPRDFRFTVGKDGALYAFCMTVPAPGTELRIAALGTDAGLLSAPVRSVKLLGSGATLEWRQRPDGLTITCPSAMPFEIALGFRVS